MNTIIPLLEKTYSLKTEIANTTDEIRETIVQDFALALEQDMLKILTENKIDVDKIDINKTAEENTKKDRLILTIDRIKNMAQDVEKIAKLPSPTNQVLLHKTLHNKLDLQKITVPLGVIAMIYESRPNVTVDAISLAIKSGNAIVLRGGSDAKKSNIAIVDIAKKILLKHKLDPNIVCLLPTDRKFVIELLQAEKYIDIIIPRGSQNLIDFVRKNSVIPIIETGRGVCHTFVSVSANLQKAAQIVCNAKLQRPSVCNSLDTILVAKPIANNFLPLFVSEFIQKQVKIYADPESFLILKSINYPFLYSALEEDFGREFLGFGCSLRIVNDLKEALLHIDKFSSKHSEAIVSEDQLECENFLQTIDASTVYSNASTRFTDGAVFELGAEIGISTQKLHARGPFALEKLVTEKWIVRGDGQVR